MTIDTIQRQIISISHQALLGAEAASKVAIDRLGKAYEWLQVSIPVAMTQAAVIAGKVHTAARPYLNVLGTWAIENKTMLTHGAIGVVIGATLASLLFTSMQEKKADN
jgi:hypothetical protein